jgi:hypothetical protein
MNSPVVENGSSVCSGSDPPTIPIPTPFVFVIDKNVPDEISPCSDPYPTSVNAFPAVYVASTYLL